MRQLPAFGVEALVVTSDIGQATSSDHRPEVIRLPSSEFAHTPVMWGLLPALLRTPPTAIIHVHVAQAFIPDLAAAVGHCRGQRVVAHYHLDVDPSGPLGLLLRPYQRTVLRWTMRHADIVVVPTADYRTVVATTYDIPETRIHVLPNGTSFPIAAAPRTPPTRPWRLISVGRLSDQKNYALLIEACALLLERRPDLTWTLDVYGDGELRSALDALVDRRHLRGHVTFHGGGYSGDTLLARYDLADIFVLATRKESFGIVYTEAMARGLPIVTTNCPGVRNVVGHERNGLLAEHDPESLAGAMAELMTDPGRYCSFSRNNLADAARYTWGAITEELTGHYRALPAAGRRPPRHRPWGRRRR